MNSRRAAKLRHKNRKPKKLAPHIIARQKAIKNTEWSETESASESEEWYSGCEHDPRAYTKGGYLQVEPGQKLCDGRYKIERRLGWGHFAMVYLATDLDAKDGEPEFVALKIQKSSLDYQEAAEEEIPYLEKVHEEMEKIEDDGETRVVKMLNSFVAFGPHGKHYVMVFEVLGLCSAELLKDYKEGIPRLMVKTIMKDMLHALTFLHETCGIVHMDIKPENVIFHRTEKVDRDEIELAKKHYQQKATAKALQAAKRMLEKDAAKLKKNKKKSLKQKIAKLEKRIAAQEELPELPCLSERSNDFIKDYVDKLSAGDDKRGVPAILGDLGTACWKTSLNKFEVGTRYGRPPEMLVGAQCGPPADIWAAACLALEYLTGDPFFDPEDEDEDGNPLEADEEHLKLMSEAFGCKWPKSILAAPNSQEFFDRKGRLKKSDEVDEVGLKCILSEQLDWDAPHIDELLDFLNPMFHRDPELRATARRMLAHPWLEVAQDDFENAEEWIDYNIENPPTDEEGHGGDSDSEEEQDEEEDCPEGVPLKETEANE